MSNFADRAKTTQAAASTRLPLSHATLPGPHHVTNPILQLQRTWGNQAVQRLLERKLRNRASGNSHASPASAEVQEAGPENGVQERLHNSGVISTRTSLRPHEGDEVTLRSEADIYSQGKTPIRIGNQLAAWDARPLGVSETGGHLREILQRFGSEGVERSVHGLARTRGQEFAQSAAEHAGVSPAGRSAEGGPIGPEAARAIQQSGSSAPLAFDVRERLSDSVDDAFAGVLGDIRVHNDPEAHRAAELVNARAFTVGRAIYFGRDQYRPGTAEGAHLLAHEVAHAIQQRGHDSLPDEHACTSNSADFYEDEATHFADLATAGHAGPLPSVTPSSESGIVHRAISFTHVHDTFATNVVVANENAAGFRLASIPAPAFQWNTDVTIHGVAGDPFANFEVGFQQVERVFGVNVHWGSGANETHRAIRPDAALPRRDSTAAGNNWYDDGGVALAAAFGANGDVRSPSFDDTPGTPRFPWNNPVAGRAGNSGWFNYSDAFVTYLSARDTTAGTGAAAFRDLANVYWNLSATGTFDAAQAVGHRVTLTTNRSITAISLAVVAPSSQPCTAATSPTVTMLCPTRKGRAYASSLFVVLVVARRDGCRVAEGAETTLASHIVRVQPARGGGPAIGVAELASGADTEERWLHLLPPQYVTAQVPLVLLWRGDQLSSPDTLTIKDATRSGSAIGVQIEVRGFDGPLHANVVTEPIVEIDLGALPPDQYQVSIDLTDLGFTDLDHPESAANPKTRTSSFSFQVV